MTDRELLELAARAHGGLERVGTFGWIHVDSRGQRGSWWSPLTDDGDALRLAVKLRLKLRIDEGGARAWESSAKRNVHKWRIHPTDDPFADARRAIVRAAAATAHKEGA